MVNLGEGSTRPEGRGTQLERREWGNALPFTLWKRYHIHPSEGRAEIGTVRAELEALGAVVEEDFNYGYFD